MDGRRMTAAQREQQRRQRRGSNICPSRPGGRLPHKWTGAKKINDGPWLKRCCWCGKMSNKKATPRLAK